MPGAGAYLHLMGALPGVPGPGPHFIADVTVVHLPSGCVLGQTTNALEPAPTHPVRAKAAASTMSNALSEYLGISILLFAHMAKRSLNSNKQPEARGS